MKKQFSKNGLYISAREHVMKLILSKLVLHVSINTIHIIPLHMNYLLNISEERSFPLIFLFNNSSLLHVGKGYQLRFYLSEGKGGYQLKHLSSLKAKGVTNSNFTLSEVKGVYQLKLYLSEDKGVPTQTLHLYKGKWGYQLRLYPLWR